jgi:hypothetical protein
MQEGLWTTIGGEMAKFDYAVNAALMLCYVVTSGETMRTYGIWT